MTEEPDLSEAVEPTEPSLFDTPRPDDYMDLEVPGELPREMSFALYNRLCSFGLIALCHGCTDEAGHRVYHPASHNPDATRSIGVVLTMRLH